MGNVTVAKALRGPLMAFVVAARSEEGVVLDGTEDPLEAAEYLAEALSEAGVEVEFSSELARLRLERQGEVEKIAEVRSGSVPPVAVQPVPGFSSEIRLFPHQIRGVERILRVTNAAEFSVQGAGKTLTLLAGFAHLRAQGVIEKVLIIGPVSSFQPWDDEVARAFEEPPKVLRWSGAVATRSRMVSAYRAAEVILCSYDTARRDVEMLRQQLRMVPTLLVLDESHYIKNFDIGARGAAMLELAPEAARRVILTGTPSPHSLLDLYTQFAFLWPQGKDELLGSPQQYLTQLDRADRPAAYLRELLSPFYHRTTQSELGLPEPMMHVERIGRDRIPASQQHIIALLENKVAVEVAKSMPSRRDKELLRQWQRARIVRLLQASSSPALLSTSEGMSSDPRSDFDIGELRGLVGGYRDGTEVSAKIAWTVAKAKELVAAGEKVLIWSWWVSNLYLLADMMSSLNPLLLYGQIKPYEDAEDPNDVSRERNIRDFKTRTDRPLLIANPSACAESISLHQACHHAIYVDRTYNCGQFLQSLNRIHRIGLPEGVRTHYWIPIVECAIETSVDRRLQQRQQTMYEFLGDDAPIVGVDWREESAATDSGDETEAAFGDLVAELRHR